MELGHGQKLHHRKKTNPILAWRVWGLDSKDDVLTSWYRTDNVWWNGHMKGKPRQFGNQGVNAFKKKEDAHGYAMADVIGQVKLYGAVWETEIGYRAEYAEIVVESLEPLPFRDHYDVERVAQNLRKRMASARRKKSRR